MICRDGVCLCVCMCVKDISICKDAVYWRFTSVYHDGILLRWYVYEWVTMYCSRQEKPGTKKRVGSETLQR